VRASSVAGPTLQCRIGMCRQARSAFSTLTASRSHAPVSFLTSTDHVTLLLCCSYTSRVLQKVSAELSVSVLLMLQFGPRG
jgi:hypothetical protein